MPDTPRVVRTEVTEKVLDPAELRRRVDDPSAGAVVEFTGVVRDHDHGRAVRALHYTAHPSAAEVLTAVVSDVTAGTDARAVAVAHRVGELTVGDVAFVVAVAADHRRAAFTVCTELVDAVKAALPVWKHQWFADGSDEWVGSA